MTYRIAIDTAPAYELITSFTLFVNPGKAKHVHLGIKWIQEITSLLDPDFVNELKDFSDNFCMDFLSLLVYVCPKEKRDAKGFLEWLGAIPLLELINMAGEHVSKHEIMDLETRRELYVNLLSKWNDQYFSRAIVEHPILQKICHEKDYAESVVPKVHERDFVEEKTGGISLDPMSGLDLVLLVPSYHIRPICLYSKFRSHVIIVYAIPPEPSPLGYPSSTLLQVTKSLADESRLRILYLLTDGPKRFIDIVQATGLSKSVVHSHLLNLRISRLIRVHVTFGSTERYSLRDDALSVLTSELQAFLGPRYC